MRLDYSFSTLFSNITLILCSIAVLQFPALAQDQLQKADFVQSQLEKLVGAESIKSVAETEYPGVYLFTNSKGGLTFVHASGDLLLVGSGYDVNEKTDILEDLRNTKKIESVKSIPNEHFIEIGPKDSKRYINVFTDIDCGYCRKLHFEVVPELANKGIRTRYIMWPRSGLNTKSFEKAVTAFCSEDREKAMNRLKGGEDLPKLECENPMEELFLLGQNSGISGTPTIITDNGIVIPGFVPTSQLLSAMEIE